MWADFSPQAGHEQAKRRPAVVVSTAAFNKNIPNLVIVCPITRTNKGYPTRVKIPSNEAVSGYVQVEQITTIDYRARNFSLIDGSLDDETLKKVLHYASLCIKDESID